MSTEEIDIEAVAALRKKRQFKKFTYRGLELEKLLDMSQEEFSRVVHCRARRRLHRGLKRKHLALLKKLRASKAGKNH
jgi:small subunit ribosomal protein S15e